MKKLTNTLQVSFVVLLAILFASCSTGEYIKGTGKIVTQEKTLGSFSRITNPSSIDTIINYGSEAKVIVSADNNVIEFISLNVSNNELFINRSVEFTDDNVSYRKIFFENDENEVMKICNFFDNEEYFQQNKVQIMKDFKEYHDTNMTLIKKHLPDLYERIK